MARNQRTDSQVVFSPTVLKLKTSAHRASLDGNEASILSGRDPMEYGSFGRMPGGKRVSTDFLAEAAPAYRSAYFQRRGVIGGHIVQTKTTTSTGTLANGATAADLSNLGVETTAGFETGQWVVVWKAGVNSIIGYITAVGTNTLSIKYFGRASGTTTAITSGASVMVTVPFGPTSLYLASGSTSVATLFPADLQVGMQVLLIGSTDGGTEETVRLKDIQGVTVSWDTATASNHYYPMAIVPVVANHVIDEVFVSQGFAGTGSGNVGTIAAGSFKKIWDASTESLSTNEWQFAAYDRSVVGLNAKDAPRRVTVHSAGFNPATSGQKPPTEAVGYPPKTAAYAGTFFLKSGASATASSIGTKIFVRMMDRSVVPTAFSPPIEETTITITGGNGIGLDATKLMSTASGGIMEANYIGNAYRRGSYFQLWQTTSVGGTYFLAGEHHVSVLISVASIGAAPAWNNSYAASLADNDLKYRQPLDLADYAKGLIPNGKHIHYSQGIMYVAGETDLQYGGPHPKISSGNMLYFSRADVDEPENFPAENFRAVGKFGDAIMGFADAADTTLVFTRQTATTIQRSGSYVIFRELGVRFGMAHEEACCTLGSYAAWVSDKSVWLYDGNSNDLPKDIGFPIRDWIEGLLAISGVRVRMGFDVANGLLWLGASNSTGTLAECKIYSIADDAWITRENVVLDAPVAAVGVESSTSTLHLYRFAGGPPNCFRTVDYVSRPVVDGGWSPVTNTLSGTFAGTNPTTTIINMTIPDGASNAFRGAVLHVIKANGTEVVRVLNGSSANSITWDTSYTPAATDKWILSSIPFRLRLPPIRGDNVFAAKTVRGLMALWDNVSLAGQTPPKYLTVKLFRNYGDTFDLGASATLKIADDVSVIDTDLACDVGATGKIIEVYVEQLDAHAAFSLIYIGTVAIMPGTIGEDFSTSV